MGSLTPGETYTYEHTDGVVYSIDSCGVRRVIGYEAASDYDPVAKQNKENKLWADIRDKARYNLTLHDALERCIEIYELIKTNERKT